MIIVTLPTHLKTLANISGDVELELPADSPVTQSTILDALESRYPMLRGTIRDHTTQKRRDFVRFFACNEDISHDSPDQELPQSIADGKEPFMIVGAVAVG
jgi:hypothetical protein